MDKKVILAVDDSALMLKALSDILENEGYEVITARNGIEGIKKVNELRPNLVLLDVVMPEMDGFEVCRILRDDVSNNLIPIIMLTSQSDESDRLEGLELGADDYITKPYNEREVVIRVRNTLKRIDRNRNANPLTGLPGNIEIQTEINRRISNNMMFAALYPDLDNFKAYNDVYGFANGDKAIVMTAKFLLDAVKMRGTNHDFIGHVGGDDYVIITEVNKVDAICREIIKKFDENVLSLYNDKDKKLGYIQATNREGVATKFPLMSISIGVASNEKRPFYNHIQVAEAAAEVKKKAKGISGSAYAVDNRIQ